ncbi:MAG: hypothetical protein ACYDEX_05540 [Mobilitalea sp.]
MVQAYNYMLQSEPLTRLVKQPANKKSELKKVYDNIVNLSKRSPLYKINLTKENQEYTIGVKETALDLKAKLGGMLVSENSGFHSKTVTVSNDQVLSAKLMSEDTEKFPEAITFSVNSLASVQVNRGKDLMQSSHGLHRGEYEFNATIMDQTYSLSYNQEDRTDNLTTLKNMADFLNESVPGINALVEKGASTEYSRIAVVSDMTGRIGDKNFSFEDNDIYRVGVVDFFGLNRMEKAPAFAKFELNGIEKQTATNTFTLENTLRITLNNSGEQPVTVRIVPDSEKILTAVDSVLNTYNNLIKLAKDRTLDNKEHYRATKLMSEMKGLETLYKEELDACGLKVSEDGILRIEDSLAIQASEDGGMESLFTRENGFIARLIDKAETIAINPMEYLDKTIVTYPNTDKINFRNPYVTSMYSGLFFSSYC